jgi:diguanylate cyclase (GGDEF)-like protein
MYLLAGDGTAVDASVAVPNGPNYHERAVPILAGIAYAAAIGVMFGFEKLPRWGYHVLLIAVTALISWAIYTSGEAGSPYNIFYVWVAIYAALFLTPAACGLQVAAMIAAYAGVLVGLGGQASMPWLHGALTASGLILLALAIQALNRNVRRLVDRLTDIGRVDSDTGLYNLTAFAELFDNEIERARRSGNRLGLVVAEFEGGVSREALAAVGHLLHTTPRQIDMAARIGAGRFGLLLPYTDEHGSYLLAERLRAQVAELASGTTDPTVMSFGVASFPRQGANAHTVLQAAECALEDAKSSGGGRVMMSQRAGSAARVEIETHAAVLG